MTKTTMKNASSKKILSIILSLVMLLSALPLTAISVFAVSDEPYVPESPWVEGMIWVEVKPDIEFHLSGDGLWSYWVLSDGKSIELCYDLENFEYDAYLGDEANLVIPSTIDGYTVVQIGDGAFQSDEYIDYSFLESVVIPDTVKYIGIYAFNGCTSLESITIPDSVTSIGDFTFQDCTSLTSIEIPDSVTSIGYQAFNGCTALTDIYIPDSVTSIGNNAIPTTATVHAPEGSYTETYAETKGIPVDNNMEIPTESSDDIVTYTENNVTITVNKTTGDVAIEGVGAIPADFYRHFISTDTIAATLQEKLAEYYDTDVILIYSGIDDPMAFLAGSEYIDVATGDRLFVTDEMLEEFLKPSELLDFSPKTLVIGEGITEIPDYAFAFFSEVTEIVLPSTIKNIGEAAFAHCRGLEYIALPEAVESIYLGSFDGCANLTSISMTAYENASDALFYGTPANVMTTTGITENETPRRCVFHD